MATALKLTSRKPTLSPRAGFALLGSILLAMLAGSSAPTPLYAIYRSEWGFSPITTTIVFGAYAVAVLTALLTVGELSDHIGRRPVLVTAVLVQVAVMVVFANAADVTTLLVARVLQGFAAGTAVGAIGAGLVDINAARGPLANAVSGLGGTAVGGMVAAIFVQFLPAPTHLVYYALAGVFLAQALAASRLRETSPRTAGAVASLTPRFAVPPAARVATLAAAPVLIAVWSLAGFYGSLGPSLASAISGSGSSILGGGALFALAGSGAVTVIALRSLAPRTQALAGSVAEILGVAIVLGALSAESIELFFLGTVIAGMGFGLGFQGALRSIVPLAGADERAGVISVIYTISYLAMGLPAVAAGYLVSRSAVPPTAREFGAFVIALAAGTLLAMNAGRLRHQSHRHQLTTCNAAA